MRKIDSVLLVDDDEATNFVNELLFKKLGIAEKLHIAKNGRDALELLQPCSLVADNLEAPLPKLILLDLNMPVLDGFGFLHAFDSLDIPGKEAVVIVILTTSLNAKDVEKVKINGVKDFVNKPLTGDALQQLLQKHFA
ncbi:response regulator [Pontibacter sp. SGAir0037]|uniref:response regulator n=1 Tax=Pontibacter sp. SGAir0037 TaxID=2571030 RepID=UPI0010CCFC86|nr:response regulator [Pontibacter sp. SGAir0037]QCR23173.1 response regulator [Pontibacter sp. SGAir0037]